MASDGPGNGAAHEGVEIDALTALGTALSRPDGRITSLADRAGQGPLLVVVVERGSEASRLALTALAASGARLAVVSQGRPEAATELVAATGVDEEAMLVDPAPHPVSAALAADGVPTVALVEQLDVVAWQDGWEPALIGPLAERAGGGPLPSAEARPPEASRTTLDAAARAAREAEDAAGPGRAG